MKQIALPAKNTCCGCFLMPFCVSSINACDQSSSFPIKRRLNLQKNDVLFTPNTPFQHLFAIEQGAIKTIQLETDGSEIIRNFYFSGELLGFKAVYTGQYQSTAMAMCDTRLCVIDYRDFLYYLQSHPELQQHILYLFSLQMNAGSYLVSTLAERKLAAFLHDMSIRLNRSRETLEFDLPMKRQDIGNYLRITPETVSRILTRLQHRNIIEISHHHVKIVFIGIKAQKKYVR